MKDLLIYLAKTLVSNPDAVEVSQKDISDTEVDFVLKVDSGDMGRVIGKHGKIARALRSIVKAAGVKENKRVNIEIVDNK